MTVKTYFYKSFQTPVFSIRQNLCSVRAKKCKGNPELTAFFGLAISVDLGGKVSILSASIFIASASVLTLVKAFLPKGMLITRGWAHKESFRGLSVKTTMEDQIDHIFTLRVFLETLRTQDPHKDENGCWPLTRNFAQNILVYQLRGSFLNSSRLGYNINDIDNLIMDYKLVVLFDCWQKLTETQWHEIGIAILNILSCCYWELRIEFPM